MSSQNIRLLTVEQRATNLLKSEAARQTHVNAFWRSRAERAAWRIIIFCILLSIGTQHLMVGGRADPKMLWLDSGRNGGWETGDRRQETGSRSQRGRGGMVRH